MLKYTKHNLTKIEQIFKQSGFQLRYGKGKFSSGYCLLNEQKIIVINKFFDIEARIACLLDLLLKTEINEDLLDEKTKNNFHDFLNIEVKV